MKGKAAVSTAVPLPEKPLEHEVTRGPAEGLGSRAHSRKGPGDPPPTRTPRSARTGEQVRLQGLVAERRTEQGAFWGLPPCAISSLQHGKAGYAKEFGEHVGTVGGTYFMAQAKVLPVGSRGPLRVGEGWGTGRALSWTISSSPGDLTMPRPGAHQ